MLQFVLICLLSLCAAIRVDLLIIIALFRLVYMFVYISCHIFATFAHDCLAPLSRNPGYAPEHGRLGVICVLYSVICVEGQN